MNISNRKQTVMSSSSSFLLTLLPLLLVLSSSSSIISVSARETTNNNLRKSSSTSSSSTSAQKNRNLIIGGTDADIKTYPRSIVYLSDRLDDLSCGGTLISPTIILAAAHCEISLVSDAVFQRYYHPSEAVGIEGFNSSSKEIRIPIKEEIKHPNYNRRTLENDVMLLILEKSPNDYVSNNNAASQNDLIPYMKLHKPSDPSLDDLVELIRIVEKGKGNSNRESINNNSNRNTNTNNNDNRLGHKLRSDATAEEALLKGPSSSPNQTPLKLTALGWGHTIDGGKGQPSDTLQEARLNYVYNSECNKAQESNLLNYDGRISPDMMCTWHSQQDTCHGDSGGPIILENPANILKDANDNTVSNQRDQYIQGKS
jgi:secreted trypsin-like serine protease